MHALPAPRLTRAACWYLGLLVVAVTFGDIAIEELHGTAAFYAALAREMLEAGDFLAPFQGPQAYLLKPPLALWLSAAAATIFGIDDFAMTLPSRLGGVGCAALTYLLTRGLFGPVAGWFAVLVFVTNGIYIQFTTSYRMDSLMTLGALLTLWGYLNIARVPGAAALFGGIAVSMLTKGPMILFMLLAFLPHAVVTGNWRQRSPGFGRWALLLLFPAAWFGWLWGMHGTELAAQLEHDFWRGDTAVGLTAMESALLEYLEKPLLRLWPWLPLMAVAPLWGIARCLSSRPAGARQRADLGLLIGLFALNYAIAVIKPDPDVRYLYPSLPLIGVLCGGLLAQMTRATLPSWVLRTAPALLVLAVLYAALISVQGLPDRRGMATMRELVAAGTVTAANSAVVVEAIPPPDAPRRNNPMPDSIYYYLGLNPPRRFAPAATADLPAGTRYVFARRRPAYQQAFIALGFAEIARSAKIALYRVPEPAGAPGAPK